MFYSRFAVAFLGGLAAVASAQFASAADLPRKAPDLAPAPVVMNWTGFYVGGNVGWARTKSDYTSVMDPGTGFFTAGSRNFIGAAGTGSASDNGFTGGGQVGYNYQWGAVVLGIEADINALSGTATLAAAGTTPGASSISLVNDLDANWIATVRPRLGYAFNNVLLYLTGGLAILNAEYSQTFSSFTPGVPATGSGFSSHKETRTGWDFGGGGEWMFMPRWSVKAEYLYARINGFNTTGTVSLSTGDTHPLSGTADATIQMVRGGINYHF